MSEHETNHRILIVDDNPLIHADFRKLLAAPEPVAQAKLDQATQDLFGASADQLDHADFQLTSAYQGQEAGLKVREALAARQPFALAFVDVRMPPGWDGIETTTHLWETDPDLQIVICTAFSDYSWHEMSRRLRAADRLVILKKPFDAVEVVQLANALTEKWRLARAAHQRLGELDRMVRERTQQLQLQGAALQSAANGVVITDPAGTVLWHNAAFSRLTGYSGPEVVGRNINLLKSGKQDAEFYRRLWQTIGAGQVWRGELVNRRKDGSFYSEEMTVTPVRAENGETTHYVAIQQDISERKELESQLRQAQKMEAIGQLAGGVAHDFNNLLTVMRGNADLVLMDTSHLQPEAVDCLKQIAAAADRAARLTRQLLAFSRKQLLQRRPLNLNDLVGDLTKMLKRVIGENIQLQCRYAGKLPLVEADAGMMEQVLVNLVVNARDAMPDGGQLLIVTESLTLDEASTQRHSEARPGRFVCLCVSDTGTGIAPEHLPRIFDPFFTTKQPGKGTGLGLATVYGIAKQHQGWVEVSSQVGSGTWFSVFLPVSDAIVADSCGEGTEPALRGGSETILLVEDEGAVRSMARRVLEGAGYRVREAASGREALASWKERAAELDLLLTDVVMPEGVSGRELATQLLQRRQKLKVILMSGYTGDVLGDEPEFLKRNGCCFLQKPCSSRALLEAVRGCLDDGQAETGSHQTTQG